MVAAGVPVECGNHAESISDFALEFPQSLRDFNKENSLELNMRIGTNSGPLAGGVIGKWKFLYDPWGNCVNTAARMEGHGIVGEIQIIESTCDLIAHVFEIQDRGTIEKKRQWVHESLFPQRPKSGHLGMKRVGGCRSAATQVR